MFEPPQPGQRSTRAQTVSFVLHAVLAWVLFMPPRALVLTPSAIQLGTGGHSTALVFSGRNTADFSDPEDATPTRHKVAYIPPDAKTIRLRPPDRISNRKPMKKAAAAPDAARAGSPNGSVMQGLLTGRDVRPAFPVHFPNPEIYPWQIPNGVEGTVIVEVTIDAQGNVTATRILQRLGHGIDEKVEAAVRNWRFHPAFLDGRPIPSQQDVLYRFPS